LKSERQTSQKQCLYFASMAARN